MTMRRTDSVRRLQGRTLPGAHSLSTDRQFVCSYLGTNWATKPAEIRATEPAGWAQGDTVA